MNRLDEIGAMIEEAFEDCFHHREPGEVFPRLGAELKRLCEIEAEAKRMADLWPKAHEAYNRIPHMDPDQYIEDRNNVREFLDARSRLLALYRANEPATSTEGNCVVTTPP